ncbi:patatin-like phospholipase family protein [Sphingomonas baiyangensis]|uniref:Patatin-like phospholipase family protein n=1 Tax=Sphingomonas baiyangensis TaxID=2572576 RepID=A0A4U1L2N0_9SPHN|nr:patatin-like phospholipase family protein [Sphingomonas baiyangensis]TKD51141.1 patatin-like phospholipase family protein [Sphingomonas baiyangensis]
MADADPHKRHRAARSMPLPECVALVLQGGGALGSYQAGVIEALAEADVAIDWVAGISIGAINAAIFAGNPPERRIERLRAFWDTVTAGLPSFPIYDDPRIREFVHEWSAASVMTQGVPGFFRPRMVPPMFAPPGSCGALSFYDSAPLADTLDALIDWELANDGPVRLSIGAVEVESGNFHYFDSRQCRIDARHVMASGALPPGLPPVEIDGKWYWDGGLVSNTPLTHVLDHQEAPTLVFQVDLFSATADRPRTLMDVMSREKEIRYSSRTRQVSRERLRLRQEREAIRRVLAKLPPDLADDPDVLALKGQAAELPVSLVHLIHRANAWEGGSRDFEFSERTMRDHWAAGREAIAETMAQSQVLAQNIADGRTAAFDLTRRAQPRR